LCIAKEKTTGIFFRVSDRERALIERRMAQTRIRNLSAYIRKMCIDGMVINLDIQQLDEIGKLLRVTANNVNQIAKRVNSGGAAYREDVAEVNRKLETIRADFGQVLHDLSRLKNA
jgi:short-subunit dehydrogenase